MSHRLDSGESDDDSFEDGNDCNTNKDDLCNAETLILNENTQLIKGMVLIFFA